MQLSEIITSWMEAYIPETQKFNYRRDAGLYANLVWIIRKIILLELNNFPVEEINIILDNYVDNRNIYPDLFQKKDIKIDFSKVLEKEKIWFENEMISSAFGLSDDIKQINFELTSQVINKFFTPSKSVTNMYQNLLQSNDIDIHNTIFIWARSTDKSSESRIPEVENYIELLNILDTKFKTILIQTDDSRVLNKFIESKIKFKRIKEIPISEKIDGFHNEINTLRDDEFYAKYKCSKIEHLQQMYCLSLFAKNSYKTIIYPGNPSTYVPILKNTFDNCYLFKNQKDLF
jgi:hypothetical protein